MVRFVLFASLGLLLATPVFAQENSLQPATSPAPHPASTIARSAFAASQRDAARVTNKRNVPLLIASLPKTPGALPAPLPARASVANAPTASSIPRADEQQEQTAVSPLTLLTPKNQEEQSTQKSEALAPFASGDSHRSLPAVPATGPKVLASREALRQRQLLLAQLDSLNSVQTRLRRAQSGLENSQRRLDEFTSDLRAALLANANERGVNPFVRVAQRYKGTPYVWGGESARGFDCSGFIMRVMRDLGYRALPHSAAEQFTYGLPIAKTLLRPGDLVFFANTYKPGISHVGIYLGRGRFIHAANSKVGTIVSSLDEPKWIAHYAGARRLLPNRNA